MTEEDAVVLREVGERPSFDFEPRDHLEIGTELGLIDMEAAARLSGSRFAYLKGDLVLLELALVRFAIDLVARARATSRSCRRCWSAKRRCSGPASCPATATRSTRSPRTSSSWSAPPRSRWPALHADEILDAGRAAAALRGLLDLLPPRGRRRRPRHPRHLPRPPVRQGRDVLVRRALASRPPSTSGCWRSRSGSSPSSRSPTASSTSPPATSAPRRRRSTTARPGSRARSATAS